MRSTLICIAILVPVLAGLQPAWGDVNNNKAAIYNYIEKYKEIVVSEMERSGVPASVKMAQAILESNAGRSELATGANNHFGIKCGASWSGSTMYRKDDDYDRNGKLRRSCFRAYEHAEESFIAHTDFLIDPRKSHRYGFLLDLDPHDYKAWARGLKKAGYATNPKYANLLISVIETYRLYELDDEGNRLIALREDQEISRNLKPEIEEEKIDTPVDRAAESKADGLDGFFEAQAKEYERQVINKVTFVEAEGGDIPEIIALELGIPTGELLEYNDHLFSADTELEDGQKVYIESKRNRYKGKAKTHRIHRSETMADIAQRYGILLEKLYKRNRLEPGQEPAAGQEIYLRGRRSRQDPLHIRKPEVLSELSPQPIQPPDPPVQGEPEVKQPVIQQRKELMAPEGADPQVEPVIHVVAKGDTLFSISRRYGLSIEELKARNSLEGDRISIGQELIVN